MPGKVLQRAQCLFGSVEAKLLLAWIAVVAATILLDTNRTYLNAPSLSAVMILRNTVLLGFFAIGAAVVIMSGGIDLSSGSMIALSATTFGAILMLVDPEGFAAGSVSKTAVVLALAGALASGCIVGTLHAWLITAVGLPPFVATLASLVGLRSIARGVTLAVTNHRSQIDFSDLALRETLKNVTYVSIGFAIFAALVWFLMSRTVFGRHLYATGGNEQAAVLSGIRTDRVKWAAYVIGSVSAALVGVVYFADQGSAKPDVLGRGYELNAIAAAVIGGCALRGGSGTIPGVVLGCLFLRTVIDAVNKVVGAGSDVYEGLIVGTVVVLAVTFSQSRDAQRRGALLASPLGWTTIPILSAFATLSFYLFFWEKPWFAPAHALVFGAIAAVLLTIRALIERSRRKG
jgi:ribose/xylose/arabinose/galactoside ABC-type transport system permease subunit